MPFLLYNDFMIITTNFLIFAFLCAIAVKNLVDLSFSSVRCAISKRMVKHLSGVESKNPDLTLTHSQIILYGLIGLIELILVGYILFSTNLFIPVVLFSVVLANFLITWVAILCPMGYIFRRQVTRIVWVYFSLNFGFFKNAVCILSFLVYLI